MESKKRKNGPILLPVYFKKIGLAVMVLAFVPATIVKSMSVELMQTQKDLYRVLTFNALILGLLFVAWSKDKVEDEMTVSIRLRAMAWSFTTTVLYVIFRPIVDLVFKDPIGTIMGQELVFCMLFGYLVMYYLQKRGR